MQAARISAKGRVRQFILGVLFGGAAEKGDCIRLGAGCFLWGDDLSHPLCLLHLFIFKAFIRYIIRI